MISAEERAIDIFNNAVVFISRNTDTPKESIKSVAKDLSLNQVVKAREALFYCAVVDDYLPNKSLVYWQKVRDVLAKL